MNQNTKEGEMQLQKLFKLVEKHPKSTAINLVKLFRNKRIAAIQLTVSLVCNVILLVLLYT